MPLIIGVVFRKNGNVHYYDPGEIELEIGDKAICHVDKAIEMGEVVTSPTEVSENGMGVTLSKIIRKATYYDLSVEELNRSKEEEGLKKFEELAKQHKLVMKLVNVHVMFDKSKMVFYFTAEKRVDFREMVKELASYFKIRIELRQIGVRDEAKIVGGLGPCGMNLCCKSFLTDFESISLKMAKDQNLPLNPLKISGICGRLMCCLKYEYESYREFLEMAPERGVKVKTRLGIGVIAGHDP
ncbi:MAG: stage 0 sporulation protein, partial [Actinobacteria bacterium]|nr:stage 0 sporulation protein [Actinomycetota bacterium]